MTKLGITASAGAMVLLASMAYGKIITGAYIGCVTEDALDAFISAANSEDYRQMQALTGTVCTSIEGLEFSVVDQGWSRSQIRVYANGNSALLWTVSEAVK